jgi:hypothetical protein
MGSNKLSLTLGDNVLTPGQSVSIMDTQYLHNSPAFVDGTLSSSKNRAAISQTGEVGRS